MISEEIKKFILKRSLENFLRYVRVWTTSSEDSSTNPSTRNQFELGNLLKEELEDLGLENIIHDEYGYVYAFLKASNGLEKVKGIGFIAHLDTSPAVSGQNVKPVMHRNYDGSEIKFDSNNEISLSIKDSIQLKSYIGLDIITSEGDTLLGADDKAGIAEIMAACAAWTKYPELKHGPIIICFTPDEEVGKGTNKIDQSKLPNICYTIDGSEMGELEFECFDAWKAIIKFNGSSVHPGRAKDLMINAIHIASRFLSEIPETESPEHTENREGFYHLKNLKGKVEEAEAKLIIRDFELENNKKRMKFLQRLKEMYELKYPGLKIELNIEHQYKNMLNNIEKDKQVIELARKAIEMADLEVQVHPIRGGTDGARLSEMGIPTPNIFTGGLLFHSKKEYIPTKALQKATEVIINLAYLWSIN
ncbi:MAG: peptidase T [Promethearchaeota archaeon]